MKDTILAQSDAWLLFISSRNFLWLLFESGVYLAQWTQTGQKMKKSTASRKVEWLQMLGSQSKETLPRLPLQWILSSRNQTPLQMLEDNEDELEENELVLKDCSSIILCFLLILIIAIASRGFFTCICATQILAAASIPKRQLFHSAYPVVQRQFKSSD